MVIAHRSVFAVFVPLFAAVLALPACSGDDGGGGGEIADTPLSGKVAGQAWTFQVGATDAFLSEDGDFFAALYDTSFTPCTFDEPSRPHLLLSIPKQPGTYDLSLMRNVTFVVGDADNLISLDGQIVVDEVTATSVTGGLQTRRDDGNDVNGQFQITVCPE
jgi:hypothetical protein